VHEQRPSPADGLAQLTFLLQAVLERLFARHGVTLMQGRLLGILRDRTPTMAELAERLQLDKSSITGLIDRAQRRGLVERVPSAHDRRSVQVRLTAEGRRLANAGEADIEAEIDELLGLLPAADRTVLTELVGRLVVAHARQPRHPSSVRKGAVRPGEA
jgi:DNA-binding MarR family transcriptional regulator